MKKFKLSAVIASILSLGVVCNSFAFASKEGEEIPAFYEDDPIADLKNSCKSEEDKKLQSLLDKLKNVTSVKLPDNVLDFNFICLSKKHSVPFLNCLFNEKMKLLNEGKIFEVNDMNQVYHIASTRVIENLIYIAASKMVSSFKEEEKILKFNKDEDKDTDKDTDIDKDESIVDTKNSCEYEDDKTLQYLLEELDKLGEFERLREFGVRNKLRIFAESRCSNMIDDFVSLCNDEEHSGEFLKFLYDEMMKLYNEKKVEAAGYMQQIYEAALYNTLYK